MLKIWRTLKHYLVPHRGNKYRPRIFASASLAVVVAVLILLEGAYYVQTTLVYNNTDFLASVLPGAIAALTNDTRTHQGLGTLAEDSVLNQAAQAKAEDMAARGYFAHVSPDGKTPWYWLQQAGYDYSYAGENLAVNFIDSSDVEKAWIESPPHYANIIKSEYTKTGVGVSHGMYEGQQTIFVVQFFATPAYAESSPVAPAKKVAQVPATPGPVAAAPSASRVLGTEVQAAAAPGAESALEKVATSPKSLLSRIIGTIIVALCALFLLVIFMRAKVKHRVKHMEVISGGVVVCLIALGLLLFNDISATAVGVPNDGQAASVSSAL